MSRKRTAIQDNCLHLQLHNSVTYVSRPATAIGYTAVNLNGLTNTGNMPQIQL